MISLSDIGDHEILHVFNFLGLRYFNRLSLVCKRWHGLVLNHAWKCVSRLSVPVDSEQIYYFQLPILAKLLDRTGFGLRRLNLSVQFTAAILSETFDLIVERCPNLCEITIGGSLAADSLIPLISCKNLKILRVYSQPKIRLREIPYIISTFMYWGALLPNVQTLTELSLDGVRFFLPRATDFIVLPRMKIVTLSKCEIDSFINLSEFLSRCPNLNTFCLDTIADADGELDLSVLPINLQRLELAMCWPFKNVRERKLAKLVERFVELKELSLRSLRICDSYVEKLCRYCTSLEVLDVSGNPVGEQSLYVIALCLPKLRCLNVSFCSNLSDDAISAVCKNGNLHSLSMIGCTGRSTLQSLRGRFLVDLLKCRELKELYLEFSVLHFAREYLQGFADVSQFYNVLTVYVRGVCDLNSLRNSGSVRFCWKENEKPLIPFMCHTASATQVTTLPLENFVCNSDSDVSEEDM